MTALPLLLLLRRRTPPAARFGQWFTLVEPEYDPTVLALGTLQREQSRL